MRDYLLVILLLKGIYYSHAAENQSNQVIDSFSCQIFFQNPYLIPYTADFFDINDFSSRKALMEVNKGSYKAFKALEPQYCAEKAKYNHLKLIEVCSILANISRDRSLNLSKKNIVNSKNSRDLGFAFYKDFPDLFKKSLSLLKERDKNLSSWLKYIASHKQPGERSNFYHSFIFLSLPFVVEKISETIESLALTSMLEKPSKTTEKNKQFFQKTNSFFNDYKEFKNKHSDFLKYTLSNIFLYYKFKPIWQNTSSYYFHIFKMTQANIDSGKISSQTLQKLQEKIKYLNAHTDKMKSIAQNCGRTMNSVEECKKFIIEINEFFSKNSLPSFYKDIDEYYVYLYYYGKLKRKYNRITQSFNLLREEVKKLRTYRKNISSLLDSDRFNKILKSERLEKIIAADNQAFENQEELRTLGINALPHLRDLQEKRQTLEEYVNNPVNIKLLKTMKKIAKNPPAYLKEVSVEVLQKELENYLDQNTSEEEPSNKKRRLDKMPPS